MKVDIYIPFAFGDAVMDFKYEGKIITPQQYVKMENEEYYSHKNDVDSMVASSFGNNMSFNNLPKRKFDIKSQSYAYYKCSCNIRNIDGSDITKEDLINHYKNKEQFGLYIYLNEQEFLSEFDLEADLKMWVRESFKVLNCKKLNDVEKLKHLPLKDLKIDLNNDGILAVLKDCKFIKLLSNIRKPVSKKCIVCGYENKEEKTLTRWICPKCKTEIKGEPIISSFGIIIKRIMLFKK